MIPDPVHVDAVILRCPEQDCPWFEAVAWDDIPDGSNVDEHPAFTMHYRLWHEAEMVGRLQPGSIVRLPSMRAEEAQAVVGALQAMAGGAVAIVDETVDIELLDPETMRAAGWVRLVT